MKAKTKKRFLPVLSLLCALTFGLGVGQSIVSQAEDVRLNEPKIQSIAGGVLVTLSPEEGKSEVSFDYWNYVNVNELLNGDLLQMKMMPADECVAEAQSVIITLRDIFDPTQVISVIVHTSNSYWGMQGTYAKVALTDALTVDNSVMISGTSQNVVGKTELVNGNADVYTTYGAIDIGDWTEDKNGVFSAGQPSEKHPNGKSIHSLCINYQDNIVKAGAARYSNGTLVMRTLADLNSDAYLDASTNMLLDSPEQASIKNLYTHEHVKNLFSSGYATLSFKFGGVSSDTVSFCIEKVGGKAITEKQDETAPILRPAFITEALQGKEFKLPEITVYENWDKEITAHELKVKAPSGVDVAVENGGFVATETGVYTLTYRVEDDSSNVGEYTYEVYSYSSLPPVYFDELSDSDPKDYYLVKEQLVVPAVQAYSDISKAPGKTLQTSAILYKDGKSVKTIEDVSMDQCVELTEAGEYELVYVSVNAYGIIISKSLYSFTVEEKAIIVLAKSEYFWQQGKTFTIPNEFCYYKGSKTLANVRVYSPSGIEVACSDEVTLTEIGEYKLVYYDQVDGMMAESVAVLHSADLANSLFSISENVQFEDNYPYPSWAQDKMETGLLLRLDGESSLSYKQEVDLSELDKETPLVKMLPYNDENGGYGKYSFQVILTSVEDSMQKIVISVKPHDSMWQYAYTHVNYDGRTLAFNTESNKITSLEMFGCLMKLSIGQGYGHANVPDYTLFYDASEKAFYINSNLAKDPWKLLDLDDASHVGVGKEWSGFASDKVMVEFNFYDFETEKASVIISKIAGQSLGGETVNDETAPKLYFEYPSTFSITNGYLPVAEVGKLYPLLQATAYDLIDGACNVSYGLFFENETENLYEHALHNFAKAGTYRYVISAKDSSGNVKSYEYSIVVKEKVDPITITFGQYQKPVVGTWFILPEIIVSGGSGNVLVIKEITFAGERLTENALNEVYLSGCGTLTIKVYAQDYLNTPISGTDTLTILVEGSSIPTLTIGGVPESALAGYNVRFNDFTATIYQNDTAVESAYRAIIVDGVPIYQVENGVVSGSLIHKNLKTSGTLSVLYVAGTSENDIVAQESFMVPIVDVVYVSDLLQPYNYDESCNATSMNVTRDVKGSRFVLTGNQGLELINPTVADGFLIKLGGFAEDYQGQKVKIIMTDYHNARINVEFTLQMIGDSCYMQLGDKSVLLSGSLNNIDALVAIEYDEDTKGFLNTSGDLLAVVAKTSQGLAFNGFESGLILVEIQISVPTENVGLEYSLLIRELGNSSFAVADNETTYSDLIGPAIGFKGKIASGVYKLGDEVYIPVAVASDMVTGESEVRVSILDSWYNALPDYDNILLTEGKTISLDSYGVYTVTYTSRDGNGRLEEKTFILMVQDTTPPTLSVNGSVSTEMKVGAKLKVPAFTVTDDNSDVTTKVFVYCPDGEVVDITEKGSYKIAYAGTYILQIYCYDEDGNVAQKIFEIKVK